MLHSVKQIGRNNEKFSRLRKEEKLFLELEFIRFAKNNMKKFHISVEEDSLLYVSTWHSDELVKAFKETLK